MKIVIAPDSYKSCLSALKVAEAMQSGILSIYPEAQTLLLPLADGGEGTTEAIVSATCGKIIHVPAHDALMRNISAFYGLTQNQETAIIEVASASGIEQIKSSELDILNASSFGSGEVINEALKNKSVKKLFIGLGGSATNDGGTGLLQALGAEFFDCNGKKFANGIAGKDLININKVKIDNLNPRLFECEIIVGCDVKNPLTGPNGASAVFGPQKGASTPELVNLLDRGLVNFRGETQELAGDGAAGGIAFALRNYLNAKIISGAEALLNLTKFFEKIENADLVITGEGKSDSQTIHGKLCYVISESAHSKNVPTALVSGAIKDTELLKDYFDYLQIVTPSSMPLDEAIKKAPQLIKTATAELIKSINF